MSYNSFDEYLEARESEKGTEFTKCKLCGNEINETNPEYNGTGYCGCISHPDSIDDMLRLIRQVRMEWTTFGSVSEKTFNELKIYEI